MNTDVKGAYKFLKNNRNKRIGFEVGKIRLNREQELKVLEYAISKNYETTNDIPDSEIIELLKLS